MEVEYEIIKWQRFEEDAFSFIVKPHPEINGDLELLCDCVEEAGKLYEYTIERINSVMSGETQEENLSFNATSIDYRKDVTCGEYQFDSSKTCELPTSMFKELVEAWVREKAKFDAENKK